MKIQDLSAFYGSFKAVTDVSMDIQANKVTALIGPSGCGKSTYIRCLNRMHEVIPGARAEGSVMLGEQDIYAKSADPVNIRRRVGMVFQKPNPFSKSIYENVVWGAKINGYKGDLDELVERLTEAGRPLGGGQGPPQGERTRALRRSAAASLHRAHPGGGARGDPDGRAGQRP